MFVPSIDGVSHHWSEDTREEDIVLGAQVFADAAARILRRGVSGMAIILQESLRGLFYAPYYAALALGAYGRKGSRCASSARRRPGGRPTACSTARSMWPGAGRCGSTRSMTRRPIATSSVLPRR